ncbi:hypothetical protein BDB01DRAFT_775423 [Pilobolus umbonatus]|nr:hypothetical protein BDB01DRAFT_775423 [Pilobolus umbonatus]
MQSQPDSPSNSLHFPSRDRTPSSSGYSLYRYSQPIRVAGEKLASLVGASLTTVGDTVYVFGGFDQYSDEIFNKLYKLNYLQDCRWSQVIYTKGTPPAKRTDHSTTLWNKHKLIIFGGSSEEDGYFNDISILDLNTMTWSHPQTHGHIPIGRFRHSATTFDNKLYIAGGINKGTTDNFDDTLLILDLETWEWKHPIPFVSRTQHMSFVYNNRLYVFGGLMEDMSRSNQLAFIDLNRSDHFTIMDLQSPISPPLTGQRFAQICGDQLVVLVTLNFREAMVEKPTTGLWSLDLPSMQWKCREQGSRYESYIWHFFSMTEDDPSFYLFGTNDEDPDEFYSMVLKVELDELGLGVIPPSQLGSDLLGLLQLDPSFMPPDFSLQSSSEPHLPPIRVHRLILLARWPFFYNMIKSGMAETVTNMITMSEPTSTIESFVKYIYSDSIEGESFNTNTVAGLLVMAHFYSLPRLLALCCRRLFDDIDILNASKIYHSASLAEERGLQQASLLFIFKHFGAVSHTRGFRELPKPILFQIWDDMPANAAIVEQKEDRLYQQNNILENGSIYSESADEDITMWQ